MTQQYTPDLPEDEPVSQTIKPTVSAYLLRYILWIGMLVALHYADLLGETTSERIYKTFASLIVFMGIEAWLIGEPFYWFKALRRRWYLTPYRLHIGNPQVFDVIDLYDVDSIGIWMFWGVRLYARDGTVHKFDYTWTPRKLRDQILDARARAKELE